MSNVDWFKRKLGTAPAAPPPTSYPPSVPPPAQPYQPPPNPNIAQQVPMVSTHGVDMTQQFRMEGVPDAIRNWQGDPNGATGKEHQRCPNCGSNNFFSRGNTSGVAGQGGRAQPAPHCFDCGHNGLFEQYGSSAPDA